MKILLIHPHDIFSPQEPWTIRIVSIAKGLKSAGREVKLIYFPLNWRAGMHPCEIDGIPVIPLSRRIGPATLLRNIIKVYKISAWADIIHFQKCFHWASLPAAFSALLRRKPLHYDWDDWEEKIFIASNKKPFLPVVLFLRLLEKYIPQIADTISVSSLRLEQLCICSGVKKEKIILAPVGADLDKFNPSIPADGVKKKYGINGPLVLYVGQLHGGQYAHLFIESAGKVLQSFPDASFMIVGDGWRAAGLREYAQRLKQANIIFTGAVSHTEVPRYIAAADICVACFEDDDVARCKSPLKIAEYLACGKPVVASNVGEVRRMINGCGILVEAGSAQSLAEGVILLLQNNELRTKISTTARRQAEKMHNWAMTANNILKIYRQAAPLR